MSEFFTKCTVGEQVVTLRVAEEFEWRRDTLENPAWIDEDRNPRLRMACLLWCMLDGSYKGLECVRDVWRAYNSAKNRKEIDDAIAQAWKMSRPKKDSKNDDGSTESPPERSS